MPSGVTYDNSSVSIKFKEAGDNYIDKSTDYKLVKNESILTLTKTDGNAISGSDYKTNIMNQGYTYVKIQFSATLNGNATIESTGNENRVELEYSSAVGLSKTLNASAKVYTLRLDVTKIDKDGGPTATLSGATFEVYNSEADANNSTNKIKFVSVSPNDGINTYRVANGDEAGADTPILVTADGANKGKVIILGLDNKTYYFKETVPPSGYTLPSSPFAIVVEPGNGANRTGDNDYNEGILAFNTNYQLNLIENTTTIDLPTTGGIGTIVFTAGGVLLMAGALFFLFGNKKKEEK